mmetsp:Transcript_34493/g.68692  ORF Transcript_34493/g.68692 Transcript_34493/m.68692 type:complete len:256 (+) Transcript_34493:1102-1869(+)
MREDDGVVLVLRLALPDNWISRQANLTHDDVTLRALLHTKQHAREIGLRRVMFRVVHKGDPQIGSIQAAQVVNRIRLLDINCLLGSTLLSIDLATDQVLKLEADEPFEVLLADTFHARKHPNTLHIAQEATDRATQHLGAIGGPLAELFVGVLPNAEHGGVHLDTLNEIVPLIREQRSKQVKQVDFVFFSHFTHASPSLGAPSGVCRFLPLLVEISFCVRDIFRIVRREGGHRLHLGHRRWLFQTAIVKRAAIKD